MKEKFYILTLGCKVNQYEAQALREAWCKAGHTEVGSPAEADVALLNSCAITENAVRDLGAAVRRIRREAPHCRVLVTGCAAQSLPEAVQAMRVDGIIPQAHKAVLLESGPGGGQGDGLGDGPGQGAGQGAGFPPFAVSGYDRSRAILKVQDGCSQHCTYCIVPLSRGASVSRPWGAVLAEAGRLADAGFGEIILNGVNLRQYGLDLPGQEDFWDLLTRLENALAPEWAGRLRLRISSLEPGQLDAKALEVLGRSRLVAPHLHLSLQSGSPAVLKRMGRDHYNPAGLPDFLRQLKEIWPLYGLGADVITGFPGETTGQFEETMNLCADLPLTYGHVFPYSMRPGTAAAKLGGQLAPEVKKERGVRLRRQIAAQRQPFLKSMLGLKQMWVVLEDSAKQGGVNEYYVECLLETGQQASQSGQAGQAAPRALTTVAPLRLEKGKLWVKRI